MLNDHFSHFDYSTQKLGLEKVKTIGDAYFVVGGIVPDNNHYAKMIQLGIEMQNHVALSNKTNDWNIKIRIGIASGELFAVVLGSSKFTFDCYGKTVGIAEKMESSSLAGCIQVTSNVYEKTKNIFSFFISSYCLTRWRVHNLYLTFGK
jgi:class 3 adenylate cyclase